jgi:Response regulator
MTIPKSAPVCGTFLLRFASIAHELGVAEITVKMHRSSAGRKLKVQSVADMLHKIELLDLRTAATRD